MKPGLTNRKPEFRRGLREIHQYADVLNQREVLKLPSRVALQYRQSLLYQRIIDDLPNRVPQWGARIDDS